MDEVIPYEDKSKSDNEVPTILKGLDTSGKYKYYDPVSEMEGRVRPQHEPELILKVQPQLSDTQIQPKQIAPVKEESPK